MDTENSSADQDLSEAEDGELSEANKILVSLESDVRNKLQIQSGQYIYHISWYGTPKIFKIYKTKKALYDPLGDSMNTKLRKRLSKKKRESDIIGITISRMEVLTLIEDALVIRECKIDIVH